MQIGEFSEAHQATHGASIEFSPATVNGDGTVSVTMTTSDGKVVGTGANKKVAKQMAIDAAVAQGWPRGRPSSKRSHDPHTERWERQDRRDRRELIGYANNPLGELLDDDF